MPKRTAPGKHVVKPSAAAAALEPNGRQLGIAKGPFDAPARVGFKNSAVNVTTNEVVRTKEMIQRRKIYKAALSFRRSLSAKGNRVHLARGMAQEAGRLSKKKPQLGYEPMTYFDVMVEMPDAEIKVKWSPALKKLSKLYRDRECRKKYGNNCLKNPDGDDDDDDDDDGDDGDGYGVSDDSDDDDEPALAGATSADYDDDVERRVFSCV